MRLLDKLRNRSQGDVYLQVYLTRSRVIALAKLEAFDEDVLLSIVGGASVAARDVYKVHEYYFRQLGKLTPDRALAFIAVFALDMTSR